MKGNKEIIDNILKEKKKLEEQYRQKEEKIKKHYNVEFEINYGNDEKIANINFLNLKYKEQINVLDLTYNKKKIIFINYEFINPKDIKEIDYQKLLSYLHDKYQLHLVVAELYRLNEQFLKALQELDIALKNAGFYVNNKL